MDFVMNHTSEEHEWAIKAGKGEGEYMSRYFFYDNPDIPNQFERTVPPGIPDDGAGQFYLPAGNGTLCDDDILSLPVGFELWKPAGV